MWTIKALRNMSVKVKRNKTNYYSTNRFITNDWFRTMELIAPFTLTGAIIHDLLYKAIGQYNGKRKDKGGQGSY